MGWARAALGLVALLAAGAVLASGGSEADPRTPEGLPGLAPPFLGTAVVGSGGLTAAIDAYGDVVDLRLDPAGAALIVNPSNRQAAGTVPAETGIVPWVSLPGREARPLWTADSVAQGYRAGSNVVAVTARFGGAKVQIVYAGDGPRLICLIAAGDGARVSMRTRDPAAARRLRCGGATRSAIRSVERGDRRWLGQARPLGPGAPPWARRMYRRSLLVLHALTDHRTGAVAAGARDGWAYVWPRDASAAALAFAAAGYREEAERIVRFLLGLGLEEAARFHGDGSPVPGRAAQGDAPGWVAAASQAAEIGGSAGHAARILAGGRAVPWRNRSDYQEGESGDYLGNAVASVSDVSELSRHIWGESSDATSPRGLVRELGDPKSGLDSAAAWGVRPFPHPGLYPAIRRTLKDLVAQGTRFGILPGQGWSGGEDPWSAPTAWTAWSLAALGERREALELMGALRRSATPAGDLPERVDGRTGVPRSATPLAWSHAFAVLALIELWPSRTASNSMPPR